MTSQLISGLVAVMVAENVPTANFYSKGYAGLRNGAGNDYEILVKFGLPGPKGAAYSNTKLRLYNTGGAIPSKTYVLRRLTSAFNPSRVKWSNKPTNTATGATSFTGAVGARGAANDYIEFDISGILNTVTTGATPWYGVVIYLSGAEATARTFYTARGSTTKGPLLDATWSTAPKTPTDLKPADGNVISVSHPIVSASYVDVSGSTLLESLRVQIHSTTDFTTPDFDSGEVASVTPEYDTSSGAFGGISDGQTKYWRIQWKDADQNWSPWSSITSFSRAPKGTVTILNPDASPDDFVEEVTPPITWSFSGTQKHAQVLIWNDAKTAIVYNSNKITTDDTGFSIDGTTPLTNGLYYWAEVRIWDDQPRATLPNDPAYSTASRRFLVQLSGAVTPTTDLVLTSLANKPWVQADFKRTTDPDFFDIFRNNVLIASNVQPEDLFVSGDDYRFIDRAVPPRTPLTYEFRPKVNGASASGNDTETITTTPVTAFLSTLDGELLIPFLNYVDNLDYSDGSTTVDILNSDEAITVYQGLGGLRGDFTGVLSGSVKGAAGTETAKDHLSNFLSLRRPENRGRLCVLTYKDQAHVVVVSKLQYGATVYKEEITYAVSFFVTEKKGVLQ